jgi:hypothetical protein
VLISVLAFSHRFVMVASVEWAIQAFDTLGSEDALTPAHHLQLSFRYEIEQWVLVAVSGLMDRQIGRKLLRLISADDIEQMGVRTFTLIVKGVETIQAARTSVAINPPPTHHCPQCRFREDDEHCNRAWRDFWLTTVPFIVLAPDHPEPLLTLVPFLKTAKIGNFHDTCKTLTLSQFEQTEVLKIETTVKEHVASAIWDLYRQDLK